MTRRRLLIAAALLLVVGGAFLSSGAPRLVLLNTALRIEYPWSRAAGALVAASGTALLGVVLGRRWLRLLLAGLTLVPLGVALHLALYRLDATDNGIVSRTPLGTTALAWRELERVEQEPDLIVLAGPGDDRIHIDTTDFEPEQRASLERAIARRVRESGGRFQESQPPGVSTDRQAAPQLGR